MLSNVELILIKFLKTEPSYAYEIERMIEDREIRQWVKIGGTTIYQVLDRLCKKGLLNYKIEKEGNMPQRKRYYVSDKGNCAFNDAAIKVLKNSEFYYFDLTVGLACRHFMEAEVFNKSIQDRLASLNDFIEHFNEKFEKARVIYSSRRLLVKEYLLSHYKLEQNFLEDLLRVAGEDE